MHSQGTFSGPPAINSMAKKEAKKAAAGVRKRPAGASPSARGGAGQRVRAPRGCTDKMRRRAGPAARPIRKRPASAVVSAGEVGKLSATGRRGKARQSFCKNGCVRDDGSGKVAQSGCQGMCRMCAVKRGLVKKTTNSGKLCTACGGWSAKVAQETHPTSGLRYCKQCMRELFPETSLARADLKGRPPKSLASADAATAVPLVKKRKRFNPLPCGSGGSFARGAHTQFAKRRRRGLESCFYCLAVTDDVLQRECGWAGHIENMCFSVCEACVGEHGVAVCPSCWKRDWSGSCFRCRDRQARNISPWGRFCMHCHTTHLQTRDVDEVSCYYCCGRGGTVEMRSCTYNADCIRPINVCVSCASLKKGAVCDKCWRRDWDGKCFNCKQRKTQNNKTWGRFCFSCYAAVTEEGKAATRTAERDKLEAKMSIVNPPTGQEPALQLLVLPRRPSASWEDYAREASYLSPVHCRLCL